MLKIVLLAAASQTVLWGVGWGLLQLSAGRYRLSLSHVFSAWGMGVLYLYIVGAVLVRIEPLKGWWPWLCLGIAVALTLAAFLLHRERGPVEKVTQDGSGLPTFGKSYLVFLGGLIAVKMTMTLWIAMVNPVIDSDAANPFRWVGLAKVLHARGMLPPEVTPTDRFSPSLLPLWVNLFLPRWHDAMTAVPWFLTYAAMVGTVFTGAWRLLRNPLAATVIAYFFSSLPLAVVHVIRPGYADLILMYFLLEGIVAMTCLYAEPCSHKRRVWFSIGLMAFLGTFLTKKEGTMWALWLALLALGYFLHERKGWAWKRILTRAAFVLGVVYVLYLAGMDYVRARVPMPLEIQWLFTRDFDSRAVQTFFEMMFVYGSFNLLWWFFFLMLTGIWIKKSSETARVLSVYALMAVIFVFYFACFTGNVPVTIQGTNLGRFFLQISGLFFPVYIFFVREIVIKFDIPSRSRRR